MAFQFYFMQLCKTSCSFSHSFKVTKRTLLTDDWRARYMSVCCPRAPRQLARQTGKTVPENIRDWNKQKQIKYLRRSLRISCVSQRSKASFLEPRPQGFSVKKMRKMHLIWVLIGTLYFTSPNGDGTAILRGHPNHAKFQPPPGQRKNLHFSVIFKTLSIGPAAGIEPATSRSAVKRATDWANPAAVS